MGGEGRADPQLPPAPLAVEEEEVDERLPWVVLPLVISALLAVGVVSDVIRYPAVKAHFASTPGGGPFRRPRCGC